MNGTDHIQQSSGGAPFRLGEWKVEPELNQFSAPGRSVRVEPKSMALLLKLAERPGNVVSRSELLSAVWPNLVVGDDSVTQAVIKLRKALGDDPENPSYIQTIPKRGYRLIAPVTPEAAPAAERREVSEVAPVRPARERRLPWVGASLAAGLLLAAAIFGWAKAWRAPGPLPEEPAGAIEAAKAGERPTLAVRPFEAIGGDPQETLLAKAITEDLVNDLSKVLGLWVIEAKQPGAASLPEAEPIDYAVSGTVQRAGDRIRVNLRLAEAPSGRVLWSERFDREMSSLFVLLEELGPKILELLPAKVSEAEMRRVSERHTHSLEAYEHFQRGQLALLARQRAENQEARDWFRQAIELDPGFARAYAGLALTYAADYRNQWNSDVAGALDRALELSETAVEINPDVPETHWVLAFVHMERRQHAQARRHVEAAIRLNPSYADGYGLLGSILTYDGKPSETVGHVRTAMRLDPRGGHLHSMNLGRAYLFMGDLEQARVNLEQALLRNAGNIEAHLYMAALHVLGGNETDASWEAEEIRLLRPGFSIEEWLATYPMTDAGQKALLARTLGSLGF